MRRCSLPDDGMTDEAGNGRIMGSGLRSSDPNWVSKGILTDLSAKSFPQTSADFFGRRGLQIKHCS